MAVVITELPEEDEIILFFLLRNRVLSREFAEYFDLFYENENIDPNDPRVFKHFSYQQEILTDHNQFVSIRASRSAGKTTVIISDIIWTLIAAPYGKAQVLYTVPNANQLQPVWSQLTKFFRHNRLGRLFLPHSRAINASKYAIQTITGAELLCRIAGQDGGARNVIGLHVPKIWIDEAGYYPWSTYRELLPVLNRHDPGRQLIVAGTPSGERDQNVLYFADMVSEQFSKYRINAFMNPLYTEEAHKNDLKLYGGEDSPDYARFVKGEHGPPASTLFDRSILTIRTYPVYKLKILQDDEEEEIQTKISSLPDGEGVIYIGADFGYVEPTVVYIIFEKQGIYKFLAKITTNRVKTQHQKFMFELLIDKYKPEFVAIDSGGPGLGLVQELAGSKQYENVVIPVKFAGSFVFGHDSKGKEIKMNAKQAAVMHLQKLVANKKIIFSTTDPETVDELTKLTYTRAPSGRIIYRMVGQPSNKQDDHQVSALLAFTYGLLEHDMLLIASQRRRLFSGVAFYEPI